MMSLTYVTQGPGRMTHIEVTGRTAVALTSKGDCTHLSEPMGLTTTGTGVMMTGVRVQIGVMIGVTLETKTAGNPMVMLQHKSLVGMTAGMLPMDMTSVTVHRQTAGMVTSMVCLGVRLLQRSCKQGIGAY